VGDWEIGGTVGDIESLQFLEAIRQMPPRTGRRENWPVRARHPGAWIAAAQELKTKAHPAQREGVARHRHPAEHSAMPLGAFHPAGNEREDRPLCDVDVQAVIPRAM